MASAVIELTENGTIHAYSIDDLLKFHGSGSPGGVAIAFKVLERVLPLLADPGQRCERREIEISTAFGGPGARDGFEMATRAVSDGRFEVLRELRRPDLGKTRERFVFRLGYRDRAVTTAIRDGFVTDEFASLAFAAERTAQEAERLEVLKRELAERVLSVTAAEVFDVVEAW